MTLHYPDLGSASRGRPIRSTTQIWVVTRHQYGISTLVSQTSFRRETSSLRASSPIWASEANQIGELARRLGNQW